MNKSLLLKDKIIEIGTTTSKIQKEKVKQLITLYVNSDIDLADISLNMNDPDKCLDFNISKHSIKQLKNGHQ